MILLSFAERLKTAMDEAGISQAELSRKSGCSKAAISQYLSEKSTAALSKIEPLADALDVSEEYLTGFDTPNADPLSGPSPVVKIVVKQAARCLGKSEQFIRIGLQRGRLPFGTAVPGSENKWVYDIRPNLFRDYVGAERFNEFFDITPGVDSAGDGSPVCFQAAVGNVDQVTQFFQSPGFIPQQDAHCVWKSAPPAA